MKYSVLYIIMIFWSLTSCTLFEKRERLLFECKTSNGERVGIYYVELGATTDDVIQIRRSASKDHVEVIKVFDNYNFLESSKLLSDSVLEVVVSDTGYHQITTKDTLLIKIK